MFYNQFIITALICAFETYFLNDAILSSHYFIAVFWALLLLKNLRKVYLVSKFTKLLFEKTTKKKD